MVNQWRFAPNHLIIRENDPGVTAYYIESGKVQVVKEVEGQPVHIAYLGPGSTFGEMSVIDDEPRSASVIAVEETVVSEFHREDLHHAMRENPEVFGRFLRSIFERLRESNRTLAAMVQEQRQDAARPGRVAKLKDPNSKAETYSIEGMTDTAVAALQQNPVAIWTWPFKVGRRSDDPFVYNHLEIEDKEPYRISRHHAGIVRDIDSGRVGVADLGSELGCNVNGARIGGRLGNGPVFFEGKEGILILGDDASPYRYRIRVSW
jgi:CRP-like cAMP-binding protein